MSATARTTPSPAPRRARRPAPDAEAQLAFRRIATLAAVALLISLIVGAFAGILVFVVGLAALSAYAASHPHHT